MKKEALRVTSTIPVAPTTLYFAWIDSTHHSSMTGMTAKLEPVVGAKYSTCNGYVTGKLVILDLGRRIVMSWRTTDFPRDAADSRVEVHFETLGLSTRILILHTEIPEGQSEKYKALWNEKYIAPMRSYFSKFLPDPRNPPPRRIPPPPPESDEDDDDDEDDVPVKGKGKLGGKSVPPAKGSSGPGVHKVDGKPAAKAPATKPAAPTKAVAPAKAAAPAKPTAPAKGKPAPKSAAPAKKPPPAPAKKPAPVAKKPAAPAKKPVPAKKPAPKKPAPKKPAPKPVKAKKKR
jgi:uncharacterized protein YndB with AHSA1/START domain